MIRIDYRTGVPIYEQVVDGIEALILQGVLPADTKLPSVRSLAVELAINPNTIQRAYAEMEAKKLIYSVRGKGNFVSGEFEMIKEQKLKELQKQILALVKEAKTLGITNAQLKEWIMKDSNAQSEKEGGEA